MTGVNTIEIPGSNNIFGNADLQTDKIYSHLITKTVDLCQLEQWTIWTSHGLSPDHSWTTDNIENIYKYREIILKANWPRTRLTLEAAIKNFAVEIYKARTIFLKHAAKHDGYYRSVRFYKEGYHTEAIYRRLLREFEQWEDDCYSALVEATAAANWFAEVVREEMNQTFFYEGKFATQHGPMMEPAFQYQLRVTEYSDEEKQRKLIEFS